MSALVWNRPKLRWLGDEALTRVRLAQQKLAAAVLRVGNPPSWSRGIGITRDPFPNGPYALKVNVSLLADVDVVIPREVDGVPIVVAEVGNIVALGALAAGPGPVITYKVDMPFPWGDDTEVTLPVKAMIDDAANEATQHLPEIEDYLVTRLRAWLPTVGPEAIKSVWPSAKADLEAELPVLIDQAKSQVPPLVEAAVAAAQPEIDRQRRKIILGFAVIAAALGALVWVRTK